VGLKVLLPEEYPNVAKKMVGTKRAHTKQMKPANAVARFHRNAQETHAAITPTKESIVKTAARMLITLPKLNNPAQVTPNRPTHEHMAAIEAVCLRNPMRSFSGFVIFSSMFVVGV
jgi:hypothetical protein